jgi:hypothetical protein
MSENSPSVNTISNPAKILRALMKATGITCAKTLSEQLDIPVRTIRRLRLEVAQSDDAATTANAAIYGTANAANSAISGRDDKKEIPPTPPKEKTTPITSVQPSSTVAAGLALPDAEWLLGKLMDAAKNIVRQDAADLQIVSVPLGWLQAGASLEIDILPLLRAKAAKAKAPHVKSWNYFTQMVADALAARTNPLPAANVVPMRPTAAVQRPIYKLPTAPVYNHRDEGISIDEALARKLITEEQAAEFRRQAASA